MSDLLTSDTMDEETFLQLSKTALERIRTALDACDPDVVECLPEADIVKVAFPSGQPFVLNTQRPVREVWLAADRNAWHFRYDGTSWRDKRSSDELMATLNSLVQKRAGVDLGLQR
jgi:CyaY protein